MINKFLIAVFVLLGCCHTPECKSFRSLPNPNIPNHKVALSGVLDSQAKACGTNEIYFGNWTYFTCADITDGSQRLIFDMTAQNIPQPVSGAIVALNDRLLFPGWVGIFAQRAVDINTNNWNFTVSGAPVNLPKVVLWWTDILWDYQSNVIYGSLDWYGMKYVMEYESPTAQLTSVLNISLACELDCGLYANSVVSVLDFAKHLYYTIENAIGTPMTFFYTIDLVNKKVVSKVMNPYELFGLWHLQLDLLDGQIYGFLNFMDEVTLFNTTIVIVDPTTATYKIVAVLEGPTNVPINSGNLPQLVTFNLSQKQVFALYLVGDGCQSWVLRTFDLNTGKKLYDVPLAPCLSGALSYPFSIASMEYIK